MFAAIIFQRIFSLPFGSADEREPCDGFAARQIKILYKRFWLDKCFYDASAFASDEICLWLSSFNAPRRVTVFSKRVIFLEFWNSFAMTLFATGAQLPFSINAKVLFWKLRSKRWSIKVFIKGKISAL